MPGAGEQLGEISDVHLRSNELSSADGLGAELTRRYAILRAGLTEAGGDALVATREGAVTYLTGYTTATWSNHSRPIVAILTPSTLDVVCAETEADAVRSRVPAVKCIRTSSCVRRMDSPDSPMGRSSSPLTRARCSPVC